MTKITSTTLFPRLAAATAVPAVAGLAAVLALGPMTPAVAQDKAPAEVSIGGDSMAAGDIMGRGVTLNGERIGQVADLIGRGNTYNDVIIRLDQAHSQMGLVLGAEGAMAGEDRPVIVGGRTVAVPLESLAAGSGETLTLSQSAVTTLDQFRTSGGQDFFTYSQGQSATLPDYDTGGTIGTAD